MKAGIEPEYNEHINYLNRSIEYSINNYPVETLLFLENEWKAIADRYVDLSKVSGSNAFIEGD